MTRRVTAILVGAGHAHLLVASRAEALAALGARVVLIEPADFWYSGLASGMLGGMYAPDEDRLDPRTLIEAHGGEFVRGRVESVDTDRRRVRLADERELAYDLLSLNVGSQVPVPFSEAMGDPSVWCVKPISNLWRLREHLETRLRDGDPPRVSVVGGGATGVEVAANLLALAVRHRVPMPVTLVTSTDRIIPQAPHRASQTLQQKLARRGLTIRTRTCIAGREQQTLIAEDGSRFDAELVVLATGLEAHSLVQRTGLPVRCRDGLLVNAKLHSIDDDRVFATGDCAALEGYELPKLGVFGVRQAAFLHANLLASIAGKPLAEYQPQKRYLAILNLGDGTALSAWGPFWWNGRTSMWLKDRIDRRFLNTYRRHSAG
ncbi:MAG: pyridine nucleotide-disulfide oxidoreductase [Planctomycetaceae bacterium]|nr:MAG: pyridine nucleotide-disulfide oxidoreductase [Planctomycetaceae bacterium]